MLVSLGFIPKAYKAIPNRAKLENANVQTFDCYLSELTELQSHGPTTGNFAGRWQKWNYVDIDQMAEFTRFQNQDKIGGVLERVALDTPLDERNMR